MENQEKIVNELDMENPIWEQVFTVNPLIVVGSQENDGSPNFAPKHMAFPLGWNNYYGFVCTPEHSTYQNIKRTKEYTITFPTPDQIIFTSLTASARCDDNTKPELSTIPTFPAEKIKGSFIENGYLFLECRLMKIIDKFGKNSLILGEIIHARADNTIIRNPSRDDNELIYDHPQLVYLAPGRFAVVKESQAFPFPANFNK